jgi:hypothetical protein
MSGYYKYMWWGIRRGENDYDFMARGDHGQYIYVSPRKNLIIAHHGEQFGIDPNEWLKIFYQFANDIDTKSYKVLTSLHR